MLRALKRMGGGGAKPGGAGGRSGAGGRGGAGGRSGAPRSALDPAHVASFERLTELSSLLMAFGEYDVYNFTKESFERAARALAPATFARPTPAPQATGGGGSMDMFGDDDAEDMFSDAPPAKRAAVAPPAAASTAQAALDFGVWSVSQLRRFLETRGIAAARDAVEKRELVDAAAGAAAAAGLAVPPGYVWHGESGFYASADAGLFFDVATGGFVDSAGKWYAWDAAAGAFVAWPTA